MIEIEAKLKVETLAPLRRRLKALGAESMSNSVQRDVYFQHPSRDFAETDEALRLRVGSGGDCSLTYKGPKGRSKVKVREEWSVPIEDPKAAHAILGRLGFTPAASVVKSRETWQLDKVKVCLDSVRKLGCFVEVEAPPNLHGKAAVSLVEDVIDRLKLSRQQLVPETYLELILKRGKG
ncbi:MAG: class IV adenylate cyclase [Candidatus Bathyarchaeia archaeon]